mgnify:CR=1 FL=1
MQALGGRVGLRCLLGVEHQLQHAAAVAKVDEEQPAVVALAMHPLGPPHCLMPNHHPLGERQASAVTKGERRLTRQSTEGHRIATSYGLQSEKVWHNESTRCLSEQRLGTA